MAQVQTKINFFQDLGDNLYGDESQARDDSWRCLSSPNFSEETSFFTRPQNKK